MESLVDDLQTQIEITILIQMYKIHQTTLKVEMDSSNW